VSGMDRGTRGTLPGDTEGGNTIVRIETEAREQDAAMGLSNGMFESHKLF